MKHLFENWRRYNQNEPSEVFILAENRLEEVLGLPSGEWTLGDPEMASKGEYHEKAAKAWDYLQQYTSEILSAAKNQNIEPELLIGVLMDEYMRMYPRALGDLMGYIGLWNTSMGIGQTKGETARKISEKGLYVPDGYDSDMSLGELQRLIANDDKVGINYTAAYIRYLDDLWGADVWSEIPQEEKNAILLTLYSHPGGESPRRPGEEEWEQRGPPGASQRGSQAATAGRRRAQRVRHGVKQ